MPRSPSIAPARETKDEVITDGALARLRRLGALLTLVADHPSTRFPAELTLCRDPFKIDTKLILSGFVLTPKQEPRLTESLFRAVGQPPAGCRPDDFLRARLAAETLRGEDGEALDRFLYRLALTDHRTRRQAPVRTARWTARLATVGARLSPGWPRTGIAVARVKGAASAHEIVDASLCALELDDVMAALARLWISHPTA